VRLGFDNVLWEALDAVGKGVAIGEIIWDEAPDRLFIKKINFKPQHLFSFGDGPMAAYSTGIYPNPQTGPLRLRPSVFGEGLSSSEPLPEKKFFVHSYRPRHGNRWGSPLLRRVYWLSWFKRAGVKQWLRLLEKGPGTVVAKYPGAATEQEKQLALSAAQAVSEENVAAIPDKFVLEVLEHVRQNMGSSYIDLVDSFCNNGIARVIRGQTLTSRGSEGGGSRALGEVHERVEDKITEVDAISLMVAVNTQIVWPLSLYNEGPVRQPPVWTIDYDPGADLELISKYLKNLYEIRVPISKAYVYNTFPGIEPQGEEDVLLLKGITSGDPATDDDSDGGFAEGQKKKLPGRSSSTQSRQPSLRMERFERLRPTTMRRSAK
jgi:phage gp29-like protein